MIMIVKSAGALALAAWAGVAVAAEGPSSLAPVLALKSVTVTFPSGENVFPGGKSAEKLNTNCLICHSARMVLTQPALSKATWAEEVAKMRKAYGAPVAEADVPAIVDYLSGLHPSN